MLTGALDKLTDADLLAAMAIADPRSTCAPAPSALPATSGTPDAPATPSPTPAAAGPADECGRRVWAEFYRRHYGYVYAVCLRAYGPLLGGEGGTADLVSEVFFRAYLHAGRFRPDGLTDPQRLRLRCRAWLGWIARRLVQDILRGRRRLRETAVEMDLLEMPGRSDEGEAARPPHPVVLAAREALEALSPREQLVIRTTMQWYRPESRHQRLPDAVAADLAATLQTTGENIRQIRRRAMRKIAQRLAESGDGGDAEPAGNTSQAAC